MRTIRLFTLLVAICFSHTTLSQTNKAEEKEKKVKILPVPAIGYAPETKTYFGAVALFVIDPFQDSLTRPSNARIEFNYTLRNQSILEADWNSFSKQEKWYSEGILHFSKYPDFYYGIGSNTSEADEILFESNRVRIETELLRQVANRLFVGGGLRYLNYSKIAAEVPIVFGELIDAQNFGITTSIFRDTRNSLLSASKGSYLRFDYGFNWGSSDYSKLKFDVRKYFTLPSGFVVANRVYNEFTLGTPNFYDYAIMGGDQFVRGYFLGRYRDLNLSTIQTEIRTPSWKKMGLAVIGGLSNLYGELDFMEQIRPNYGLGFRYLMDKENGVNLRFDYVLGDRENNGFYISFGESF
ncbi:MAG: BamA/TamA family outer membrane protein [Bacteroidota bacterium]